ncbi:MAG: hypothetical protein NXI28_17010, partial [bacterium]|nr:hypothetical protein [bacterium]
METKQALGARGRCGACDHVIVADDEIAVRLVDPDDTTPRIVDQIVVKNGGSWCGGFAESGYQISMVFGWVEVEQVVVNLDSIANKFDRVTVSEIVVVDVKRAAAFWHRPTCVFWNGDRPMANVVINLHVLVVLERELHREVDFDRIVVNSTSLCLAAFDPVELILFGGL